MFTQHGCCSFQFRLVDTEYCFYLGVNAFVLGNAGAATDYFKHSLTINR